MLSDAFGLESFPSDKPVKVASGTRDGVTQEQSDRADTKAADVVRTDSDIVGKDDGATGATPPQTSSDPRGGAELSPDRRHCHHQQQQKQEQRHDTLDSNTDRNETDAGGTQSILTIPSHDEAPPSSPLLQGVNKHAEPTPQLRRETAGRVSSAGRADPCTGAKAAHTPQKPPGVPRVSPKVPRPSPGESSEALREPQTSPGVPPLSSAATVGSPRVPLDSRGVHPGSPEGTVIESPPSPKPPLLADVKGAGAENRSFTPSPDESPVLAPSFGPSSDLHNTGCAASKPDYVAKARVADEVIAGDDRGHGGFSSVHAGGGTGSSPSILDPPSNPGPAKSGWDKRNEPDQNRETHRWNSTSESHNNTLPSPPPSDIVSARPSPVSILGVSLAPPPPQTTTTTPTTPTTTTVVDGRTPPVAASLVENVFVGRRVCSAESDAQDNVLFVTGYVRDYVAAKRDEPERWIIAFDNGEDEDLIVDKEQLDAMLKLQMATDKVITKKSPDRKTKPSTKRGRGRPKKRKEVATSDEEGEEGMAAGLSSETGTPAPKITQTGKGAWSTGSKSTDRLAAKGEKGSPIKKLKRSSDYKVVLTGTRADMGKLVAREFQDMGIFTGEVVRVFAVKQPLWSIRYEDGDQEDLDRSEMEKAVRLYQFLLEQSEMVEGSPVALDAADLDEYGEGDAEKGTPDTKAKGKGKAKSPAKGTGSGRRENAGGSGGSASQGERMVGTKVRKSFGNHGEFDGKVMKYHPAEGDDDEDLWLVRYTDGDREHMSSDELDEAKRTYDRHYALQKKEVTVTMNANRGTILSETGQKITVFAEKPRGSRVFTTLEGYRATRG